jgi:hypothetical protein
MNTLINFFPKVNAMNVSTSQAAVRQMPALVASDGGQTAVANANTGTGTAVATAPAVVDARSTPLEALFPGAFGILFPAVLSAIPQILSLFRDGPPTEGNNPVEPAQDANSRFLPELLMFLGPLLSQVVPAIIQQIQSSGRMAPGASDDDKAEAMERALPDVLGAAVKPLVTSLRSSLAQSQVLFPNHVKDGAPLGLPRMVRSEVSGGFLGMLVQVILPAISSVLPDLFGLVNGDAPAGRDRELPVNWADFKQTHRLHDNDNITVRFEPIDDRDYAEFVVELGGGVSWWKGLQVQNDSGNRIVEVSVQNRGSSPVARVRCDDILNGGSLQFLKAKFFGAHTPMYHLQTNNAEELRGQRATFYWSAD